jgi:hypothetical protein
MKKKNRISVAPFLLMAVVLILTVTCKKDDDNTAVLFVLTTTHASSIAQTTATSNGNLINNGGEAVTARGICWGISNAPSTALTTKTSDGTGKGSFLSSITGLTVLPGGYCFSGGTFDDFGNSVSGGVLLRSILLTPGSCTWTTSAALH